MRMFRQPPIRPSSVSLELASKPPAPPWLEPGKSLAIVLLFASALYLSTQIQAFSQLSTALNENPQEVVQGESASLDQGGDFLPLAMMANLEQEGVSQSYGVLYQEEEVSALFALTSNLLREALSGLTSPQAIRQDQLLEALDQAPSLFCQFQGELPLEVLYGWLAGTDALALSASSGLLALAPWGEGLALFYQEGLVYYACPVANMDPSRLSATLESLGENQVRFAFQVPGFEGLHPLTLLPDQGLVPLAYQASTPFLETNGQNQLLQALDFPLANHAQYATSDAVVIRIGSDTLRLSHSGTLQYTGQYTSQNTSRYQLALGQDPTLFAQAEGCRQFALQLLQHLDHPPQLQLTAITPQDQGHLFTFDYHLEGIPILFTEGLPGAEFHLIQDEISSFSLQYRSYSPTDSPSPVLPLLQAQAILQGLGLENGRLLLVYQDGGNETLLTNWVTP